MEEPTTATGREGVTPARAIALFVLVLVVANAFHRDSDSILPQTVLWLVAWGLLPILAYTLAFRWSSISPFETLRPLARTARGQREPLPYPSWLGAWPAVALLLALIGLEVSDHKVATEAYPLALAVFAYVFVTLVGMTVFGAAWLDEAEVFTRMFRWWRAVAPFDWSRGRPYWRGVGGGLERLPVHRAADVAFTIALLFGVNFDAFLATPIGASALHHFIDFGLPFPHASLLLAGFVVFLAAWLWAARAMRKAAESLDQTRKVAATFAAALLPIAAGYHLAHNLFLLVAHGPRFIIAILDPLGFSGWPPAGLPERWVLPESLLGALGATQVLLILVGHVVAVVVAHHIAFGAFPSRLQAVRSEVPLTLVMVAYTWTGLWLLSAAHGGGAA